MKKIMAIIIFFLFLSSGCDCIKKECVSSRQKSSKEEAIYKSYSLENFDENLIYLSVSSVMLDYEFLFIDDRPVAPQVAESSDSALTGKDFIHILVNKDKDGKLWLIFLNDNRPPEVVFKKKLN